MSVISPPEPMALPRRRRRFKRPSAVTLVAWLLFLQFVLLLSENAVPFSEVSAHRASLEEAYLELTRDAVEYRAEDAGTGAAR